MSCLMPSMSCLMPSMFLLIPQILPSIPLCAEKIFCIVESSETENGELVQKELKSRCVGELHFSIKNNV
jgi:hypothetical protein